MVAPAGDEDAGHLDDELGVALGVAHLKLAAHVEGRRVAEHLSRTYLPPFSFFSVHLVDAAQGLGLVLDIEALKATWKAVRGKRTRHPQHPRRPLLLHQVEVEGANGRVVAATEAVAADAGVSRAP